LNVNKCPILPLFTVVEIPTIVLLCLFQGLVAGLI
jgi:hypothetical protein